MRQGGKENDDHSHYACCSSPAAIQTDVFSAAGLLHARPRDIRRSQIQASGSDARRRSAYARWKRRGSTCLVGHRNKPTRWSRRRAGGRDDLHTDVRHLTLSGAPVGAWYGASMTPPGRRVAWAPRWRPAVRCAIRCGH